MPSVIKDMSPRVRRLGAGDQTVVPYSGREWTCLSDGRTLPIEQTCPCGAYYRAGEHLR